MRATRRTRSGEDLIFRTAPAIAGGREWLTDGLKLEKGARPESYNNFQGRYAIRHPWTGAITCDKPERGIWGGPPDKPHAKAAAKAALDTAYAPRGTVTVASMVLEDVPELGVKAKGGGAGGGGAPAPAPGRGDAPAGDKPAAEPEASGCAVMVAGGARSGGALPLRVGLALLVGLVVLLSRRRRS